MLRQHATVLKRFTFLTALSLGCERLAFVRSVIVAGLVFRAGVPPSTGTGAGRDRFSRVTLGLARGYVSDKDTT